MAGWKDKRMVMQRYDLTADMYEERYAAEQQAKYGAALENVGLAGKRVLDVGCGTGLFFGYASAAEMVVGIDLSRKLLQKAQAQAKKSPHVFVVQADADHLPFAEGFFEAVFAFTVLQNMPKAAGDFGGAQTGRQARGLRCRDGVEEGFSAEHVLRYVGWLSA